MPTLPEKVDPVQLARLGSLPIKARVIVEGALSGLHRAAVDARGEDSHAEDQQGPFSYQRADKLLTWRCPGFHPW